MDQPSADEEAARPMRRDAQENRLNLLATAKHLFATQGVEATSMAEIARAVGVGQGTLYRHFADKGALCQALIAEDIAAFQTRVGALIGADNASDPLERLHVLIQEKTYLTESHLPLFAAMDDGAGAGRRAKPGRGPFYLWQHEQITTLLEQALARGTIAAIDIPMAADTILAAVSPHLYSYQRQELGYSNERIVAGLQQLFVAGLRTNK